MTSELEETIKAHAKDLQIVQITAIIVAIASCIIGLIFGYVIGKGLL